MKMQKSVIFGKKIIVKLQIIVIIQGNIDLLYINIVYLKKILQLFIMLFKYVYQFIIKELVEEFKKEFTCLDKTLKNT